MLIITNNYKDEILEQIHRRDKFDKAFCMENNLVNQIQ